MVLLYGTRNAQITNLLKSYVVEFPTQTLVIDNNHVWNASNLGDMVKIIAPNHLSSFLDLIISLPLFLTPRIELIIIDNLPIFFRDYQDEGIGSTINLRAYGASLALLKRLTARHNILISSYTHGVKKDIPFMAEISRYYCDEIVQVERDNGTFKLTPSN